MYLDIHLAYVAYAIRLKSKLLLGKYINWIKTVTTSREIPTEALLRGNQIIRETLLEFVPEKFHEIINDFLVPEEDNMDSIQLPIKSIIRDDNPFKEDAKKYLSALLKINRQKAFDIVLDLVNNRVYLKNVYLNIFQPVQNELGRLWELNEISVAQEHFASAATQSMIAYFFPEILKVSKKRKTLIAACVGKELHELGIRMIADFFEMNGWNTIYLGANNPINDIIHIIKEFNPEIVALSASMINHVIQIEKFIKKIRETNKNTKVIVGGYPFNIEPRLSSEIGADGYAKNASDAINLAYVLIKRN